jgi:DNA topoisomerase-1
MVKVLFIYVKIIEIHSLYKDKKKVVSDLKNTLKSCSDVILAADEDREGEAIAASLADVLKLKDPKRIVFNEITKTVLMNALKNPRKNVKKIKR